MRIKIIGEGPIYEEVTNEVREQWRHIVGKPPYDLLILANVRRIVPKEEYTIPKIGTLCFHPSMLPKHRGYDAVWWAIGLKEKETGVTWFWVNDRIDAGPIAIQRSCAIPEGVSPGRLYYSTLVPLGVRLLRELLPVLARGEKPMTPQDERLATYEPGRPVNAG